MSTFLSNSACSSTNPSCRSLSSRKGLETNNLDQVPSMLSYEGLPTYQEATLGAVPVPPSSYVKKTGRESPIPEPLRENGTLEEIMSLSAPKGLFGRFSPEYRQFQKFKKELEILRHYDTVIVVDDSTSMRGARWRTAYEVLARLADVAMLYDQDGVDIYFLNNRTSAGEHMKSAKDVEALFRQVNVSRGTPIARRLRELTEEYMMSLKEAYYYTGRSLKPRNYIVITDGVPSRPQDVIEVIKDLCCDLAKLNCADNQLGIQFLQIGDCEWAAKYLQCLDGDLRTSDFPRDIVDASPYVAGETLTTARILKVLKGAIDRRIDRSGSV